MQIRTTSNGTIHSELRDRKSELRDIANSKQSSRVRCRWQDFGASDMIDAEGSEI